MEGTSPEESPENKTGIVRCDLIDCANNFKEITTMPARSLCKKLLQYTGSAWKTENIPR